MRIKKGNEAPRYPAGVATRPVQTPTDAALMGVSADVSGCHPYFLVPSQFPETHLSAQSVGSRAPEVLTEMKGKSSGELRVGVWGPAELLLHLRLKK